RITELACAIVDRIAPGFDARTVVPPLVMQAVEAAQAEQFLLIRVHPSVRQEVTAGLGAVRQAHPAVGVIELVDDPSLEPTSCVVVSEAGEVRAGVAQPIEAVRSALAGSAAQPGRSARAPPRLRRSPALPGNRIRCCMRWRGYSRSSAWAALPRPMAP